MWTPEIVKARFHEAAEVECRLPNRGLSTASGFWPAYHYEKEDMKGWDQQAYDDHMEKVSGRKPATSDQVTRHEECLNWTINLIELEDRRHLIWAWAHCKASDRDFGTECNRRGWARPTAYRRLNALFRSISDKLSNSNVLLRMPSDKYARQISGEMAINSQDAVLHDSTSSTAIPNIPFRAEKPRDLLNTEEAIEQFQKHLNRENARRRKLQQWRDEELPEAAA